MTYALRHFYCTFLQVCCPEMSHFGLYLVALAMEIESIDIENRLLHLRYYGLQRQGPDFRPAPHRIAVAQRVVSNPSRGSVTLYQIRDAA